MIAFILVAWFHTDGNIIQTPVVQRFNTLTACEEILAELRTGRGYSSGHCTKVEDK